MAQTWNEVKNKVKATGQFYSPAANTSWSQVKENVSKESEKRTARIAELNKEPTAWERVKNTASGWGSRQASSYAGAAENFLEIAKDLDTKNSASFKKANQAKENAAHYREMLDRGTWDNGATITADDRKQLEKLIASEEKNAKVYAEGAAKIHEPISGVIANVDAYGDRKAKESEAALTEAKRGAGTVGKIAVDLGVVAGDIASDALANIILPGSAVLTRGTRMYGEGAESAEDKGFGLGEQFAYGAGKAALGELTNRAFSNNPILEKAFGKGALDDIVLPGLNATKGGRIVKGGLGEALEETVENIGGIGLQALLFGDKRDKITAKDVGYDALLASIIGSGTTAISPSPRNSAKESPATQIAKNEGGNAPKTNVAQNANTSDSGAYTQAAYKQDMSVVEAAERELLKAKAEGADATRIALLQANVDNAKSKVGYVTDGLGAANLGFDPYTNAQNKYGTQESGENPVRSDDVPVSVDGETNVSHSVVTAKGAKVTPDAFVPLLENETMKGGYSFVPITNDQSVQAAEQEVMHKGWEQARADWTAAVRAGKAGDQITAMGALLYNNAVNAGDYKAALDIFADYQQAVRNTARGLQAARILKSMTPDSRLYLMQRSIQNMVDNMGLKEPIEVPSELLDAYKNAKTDKDSDAAVDAIQKYVAERIPSTLMDMWTALRYTNMLGNFKTQGRNVIGNVAMRAVSEVQNAVATFMERVATRGKYGKTRSVFVGSDLKKAAKADFDKVRTQALGENKYTLGNENADAFSAGVNDKRTIFKIDESRKGAKVVNALLAPMELYRKGTNWMMNNEFFGDAAFLKGAYTRYLGGYLQANGVTAEQFNSPEWQKKNKSFVDKARQFAIQQAQEVTFRDSNILSDWVSSVGRKPTTPKAVKALAEGASPFRKTPANILVRAEEYSPLGLINTAVEVAKTKNGTATGTDVINSLSKSLTGTGIFLTGMMLAANGMLRGGGTDDEKQDAFDELTGHQDYSLVLQDGTSITLDWLSPAAMPLFMGAEFERLREEGGSQLKDLEASLTSLAEPMVQMSMLQGINDTLNDLQYAQNANFGQIAATLALNYLTQGLTNSLLGQISRSTKEDSMMTYVDKESPLPDWLQREIGAVSRKFPGDGFQQIPYIDAWGRTESTGDPLERAANNLFNPAYMSEVDVDNVETELQRLYDAVGTEYGNPFPKRADKSFDVDGKTKNLTADEYVKYAKAKGENSYKFVQQAMQSPEYKSMNNAEKAEFVADVYGYANYKAKKSIESRYKNNTYDAYAEAEARGIAPTEYSLYRLGVKDLKADKDKNGESIPGSKKEKVIAHIDSLNLSPTEKDWLFLLDYESKDERTNQKNLRQLPWNQ